MSKIVITVIQKAARVEGIENEIAKLVKKKYPKAEFSGDVLMTTPTLGIDALQGRELDAAVAEWMGWTNVTPGCYTPSGRNTCGNHPSGKGGYDGHGRMIIPYYSYYANPSSMLEVENEIERRGLTEVYVEALFGIVAPEYSILIQKSDMRLHPMRDGGIYDFIWRMVHASPERKCKAALKAVLK